MSSESRPLRVAILTSHAVPGLRDVLTSPNRGSVFEIVTIISSEPSFAEMEMAEEARIPIATRPIRSFCLEHGIPFRSLQARDQYDDGTAHILRSVDADYVFLAGYRYLLSDAFVAEFERKIVALHDGDFTVRDDDGRRRYTGLHAVREALMDGEQETRCSAFFVTREIGTGPLFLLSEPYPVSPMVEDARDRGDVGLLFAYADLHRRWMVRSTWGPMLARGIEFLAAGRVQFVHDLVWIDGVPGPCRMGDAPSVCRKVEQEIDRGIPKSCPLIRQEPRASN